MTDVILPQPDDPLEDPIRFWRGWANMKWECLPLSGEDFKRAAPAELKRLLALRDAHKRGEGPA